MDRYTAKSIRCHERTRLHYCTVLDCNYDIIDKFVVIYFKKTFLLAQLLHFANSNVYLKQTVFLKINGNVLCQTGLSVHIPTHHHI